MESPVYQQIYSYALRALTRRAHTSYELKQKLRSRPGCTASIAEQVIARLKEQRFLDDEEYVRRAVEHAVAYRLEGLSRLSQRLFAKGISSQETRSMWRSMDIDENALAQKVLDKWGKRFANLEPYERHQKSLALLQRRGLHPQLPLLNQIKAHRISSQNDLEIQ